MLDSYNLSRGRQPWYQTFDALRNTHLWESLSEKTLRTNPELEPLRQFEFASIVVMAAILRQHELQTESILLLLYILLLLWGVDYMMHEQQLAFHISFGQAQYLSFTMERKLHLRRWCSYNMRNESYQLDWRRAKRQGSFLSMRGVFVFHWTATDCLKLGSLQSIKYCSVTVFLFLLGV